MANESLIAFGLAILLMLLIALYANKHREQEKPPKKLYKKPNSR